MCTLTLAWRCFEDYPIAVAANRDESLDRPASPPGVFGEEPRVVAPRDDTAGGTWIGYNEHGLFVGLANRWTDRSIEGERSRGRLVADSLRDPTAKAALSSVEAALDEDDYAGFNLVGADADRAWCVSWDGERTVHSFDPGVHAVGNVSVDDWQSIPASRRATAETQAENLSRLREALAVEPDERVDDWHRRATRLLADHELGACVHGDTYGTRSTSLIALGASERYRFANGPPCATAVEAVDIEGQL